MNTAAIRAQISRAQEHEAETKQLAQHLAKQLPHLHAAIELPDTDKNVVMTRFVSAYIEQVPDLLDAANAVAHEAGIESQIKPVLKIAEQYFAQPLPLLDGHPGLEGLLDEAYLAHRLVEEVNDLYIKHLGQPFAVSIDRFHGKAFVVKHLVERMVHGFVQLVGKGLAD